MSPIGRVFALSAAVVALGACDDGKPTPTATGERSQAVAATGPAPVVPTAPATASARPVKKAPRKLCGATDKAGRPMPDKPVSRAAAPGAPDLPTKLQARRGGFTWVNFWAAWCEPCKEEMPRLLSWEKKLKAARKAFDVVFITLDDDPRQLDAFLKAQPTSGVRASYWLAEGKERQEWLEAVGVEPDPQLPVHLIFDAQGELRCQLNGAVEDDDFGQLVALLASSK